MEKPKKILRNIPSVDQILRSKKIRPYADRFEHQCLVYVIRREIEQFRSRLRSGETRESGNLEEAIVESLEKISATYYCYAINATGIVLHTGLGRAPFNPAAADVIKAITSGYCRLQIDDEGRRSDRYSRIDYLLRIITSAEAGMIVNNNAAATLLILNSLARGREVIISRGQLIEIGGDFRLPEIMLQSGAVMREVGTTNRTHLRDYENAMNENTAAILRVHQSNFRILGFTRQVELEVLVELARRNRIMIIDDLGSGALIDLTKYGLPKEPVVQESIRIGADVVCFSGDKLLGGPQCGIIIGKKDYVEQMKRNPLTRALRCDKITNALLESSLQLYLQGERVLLENHRVLNILLRPLADIRHQAERCLDVLHTKLGKEFKGTVREAISEIGGGSLSTEQLPTYILDLQFKGMTAMEIARALRQRKVPIYGRVSGNALILDFRTVFEGEEKIIAQAITEISLTSKDFLL